MKGNVILLFAVGFILALLVLSGCQSRKGKQENSMYRQMSMEEAQELMKSEENYIILDVRTEEAYRYGHIPGAVLLPNETIGDGAVEVLPDKNQTVFVYCRSGNRSRAASEKLSGMGYTGIIEMAGIRDWKGELESE